MGERQGSLEKLVMLPDPLFWQGKRVLVTGNTGFKGGWLSLWLTRLGASVTGFSLPPATDPALFTALRLQERMDSHFGDLRDLDILSTVVARTRPEIVFHLAAQPLVTASYADPVGTFASNVQGTVNLLDAVRRCDSVRACVAVTTDKVYHNREWAHPYREADRLGGHDPYSASKAAAEIVIASYRSAFLDKKGVRVASARAGNVIGGGDWSDDRLIPDAMRNWLAGKPLQIRRPDATRPWQHVVEPVRAYLLLAERLWDDPSAAGSFNFGPESNDAADVRTVIEHARAVFGRADVEFGSEGYSLHEAGLLALDISKARHHLGIAPRWTLTQAVERTVRWYRNYAAGGDAWELCLDDLAAYEAAV